MILKLILFVVLLSTVIIYITISERFLQPFRIYASIDKQNSRINENCSSGYAEVPNYTAAKYVLPGHRTSVEYCSHWHYRVSTGSFPTGAPFIRVQDVCVRDTMLWFLFTSHEESKAFHQCLSYCCNSVSIKTKECNRLRIPKSLCENLHLFQMFLPVFNRTFDDLPAPILPGRSYLLDTAIEMRYHFGHTVSKFLQLYILNEKFEHVLINRVGRLPGGFHYGVNETNIRNIYDLTVGRMNSSITFAKNNITCVEELWWVPNYEQMFFSWSSGQQWRRLLQSEYSMHFRKCPPARAVFLQRTEGMRRRVINIFAVYQLAKQLGISLEPAYIGSHNTTLEHIQLFSSFGILISTHSSALKALIFSSPNAVVIEITGRYIPDWRASPFQLGTEFLDIHYIGSKGHSANWTSCIGYCDPPNMDRDADLFVNVTALRSALMIGLARQRHHCPNLQFS